jgi:hypothetical protein
MLGASLAIVATALVAILLVPGSVEGLTSIEEVPGATFTLAFAVLIVAVVFALPRWLGVRR